MEHDKTGHRLHCGIWMHKPVLTGQHGVICRQEQSLVISSKKRSKTLKPGDMKYIALIVGCLIIHKRKQLQKIETVFC